jgi:peptidyl-prolyl cis-trans isomerase SurA
MSLDQAMPKMNVMMVRIWRAATAAAFAFCTLSLAVPDVASAQVVVVANGSPITELDVQQRTKLIATSSHKAPSRQEVIQELIDDRLKLAKAKSYGFEIPEKDVDNAFEGMATRQHITPQQFAQVLERAGISANAVKARIRVELTWNSLVRGKFSSSLQVNEGDVRSALQTQNQQDTTVGYTYTLYPVTVIVPRGASEGVIQSRRQAAENLRARFLSCNEGLALARTLRDVAVREPLVKNSADLAPALRDLLGSVEVGRLTAPEMTPQGVQMVAICGKKETTSETPAKREAREELFSKRFEIESKRFLDEIRKQAMIEYK